MAWRLVDHTADVAIEAEARTPEQALADAAQGLTAVLTGRKDPRTLGHPEDEATFKVEAPDLPALAVAFLAELVWLAESDDLLWISGGVTLEGLPGGVWRAVGRCNAIRHDVERHGRGVEVKAVTYHDLAFERRGEAHFLRVVLDL